jgi:hypothetical protein
MNTRPTRAPAPPPAETIEADPRDRDHEITVEPIRAADLPAVRQHQASAAPAPAQRPERERVQLPTTGFAALADAIAGVMAEIKPVAKEGWNDFHKYNYARMQDLMGELTPLMGKHGVVVFQNEMDRDMFDEGRAMAVRYEFTIVHKSGEIWPERPIITGVSMCRTSNGKYDDKAFNKCHTSARKYFLLSLFQIPTDDAEDADNGGGEGGSQQNRPRPQGQRRPVPAPDGKLPPHGIAIIDGEAPGAWGKRFKNFIAKTESVAEIDSWYDLNAAAFNKLKGRFQEIYDDLVAAMDARNLALNAAAKPEDKISSGPAAGGDFPGDTKLVTKEVAKDEGEIPWQLDRKLSDSDKDWLMSLKEAFEQCTDVEQVAAEQESIMAPARESVSPYVWQKAADLLDAQIERVQRG